MSTQEDPSLYRKFLEVLSCKCGDRSTTTERVIEIHERNPEIAQTPGNKQINSDLMKAIDSADKGIGELPTARPGSRRNSQQIPQPSQIEVVGSGQQSVLTSQVRMCHDSQIIHIPITSMLNPQIKLSNTKYFEGSATKDLNRPVPPPVPLSSQVLNHLIRPITPKNDQPANKQLIESLIKPVTPRKLEITQNINQQMLSQLIRPSSGSVLESTRKVISRPSSIPKIVFTYENPRQSQVDRFVASGYKPSEVSAVSAISIIQPNSLVVSDRQYGTVTKINMTTTVPAKNSIVEINRNTLGQGSIERRQPPSYAGNLQISTQQQNSAQTITQTVPQPVSVVDYATFGKQTNVVVNLKPEPIAPPSFHSTYTFNQQPSQSDIPEPIQPANIPQTSPSMYRFANTKHVDSIKMLTSFKKSDVINDDLLIQTEGNAVSNLPDQPSPKDKLMGDSTVQP